MRPFTAWPLRDKVRKGIRSIPSFLTLSLYLVDYRVNIKYLAAPDEKIKHTCPKSRGLCKVNSNSAV